MKSGSPEMLPRRFGFGSCEARSNAKSVLCIRVEGEGTLLPLTMNCYMLATILSAFLTLIACLGFVILKLHVQIGFCLRGIEESIWVDDCSRMIKGTYRLERKEKHAEIPISTQSKRP
jgi:hypothetical protein